ncbi:GNAT family N-acetyltransferase [Desulfotalea psychrophila]|uniref:N-acetyltransferase domain-containing protein n=1 Tax=Desulfotalea psychrophila (strain LSv54 / DSM 12343) TaxID=177439 RepID=Q6AN51_DESPS|nr:GNAT family N-acetyltransferase [Desulfotalea psychrophila]CAG36223.1 hypothetical protein DP1494 [Desulfotalea psychrophila LSv54]
MVIFRRIEDADWPYIEKIEEEVYVPSLGEELVVLQSKYLASPATCLVAVEESEELAGYCLAYPLDACTVPALNSQTKLGGSVERGNIFIHDLAISAKYQGRGLGAELFAKLCRLIREQGFSSITLVAVQEGPKFWHKLGFTPHSELVADIKEYGVGAQFMVRNIV